MPHLRLIHWNAAEAAERARLLRAAGYEASPAPLDGPSVLRVLRAQPPDAVVIDLTRLPSHGREIGVAIRRFKDTRHVPIVFVEGEAEKIERIRKLLPDATFTTWPRIRSALKQALANAPNSPVVPASNLAGYSGTPLPKKLGIKPDFVVALDGAPDDFEKTLGDLPEGAKVLRDSRCQRNLTLWFVRSRREIETRIRKMVPFGEKAGLWILWPKKASGVVTDVNETVVRQTGLANGLVDFKIAAIDATWSGLRFTRRSSP